MFQSKLINKKVLDFACENGNFLQKVEIYSNVVQDIELEKGLEYYEASNLLIYPSLEAI
jgi:hypothetical protein